MTVEIRRFEAEDALPVRAMLVDCFLDDPGFTSVFPGPERAAALDFLFARLLAMRVEAGARVWVATDGPARVGLLSWAPSTVRFGLGTYVRHGLITMPLRFGFGAVRRMLAADDEAGALRRELEPPEPHAWFSQFAVARSHRGGPTARALWRATRAELDAGGLGAATMTTEARNVGVYGRHGFQVRAERRMASGATLWMLTRAPGSVPPRSAR